MLITCASMSLALERGRGSGDPDRIYQSQVPEFRWHPIVANQRFTIGDTGISVEPIAGTCDDTLSTRTRLRTRTPFKYGWDKRVQAFDAHACQLPLSYTPPVNHAGNMSRARLPSGS